MEAAETLPISSSSRLVDNLARFVFSNMVVSTARLLFCISTPLQASYHWRKLSNSRLSKNVLVKPSSGRRCPTVVLSSANHSTTSAASSLPKSEPPKNEVSERRLTALRAELSKRDIDAFIIPSTDNHHSEYPAPCFARRSFISLFDGSAGTAVVTANEARLWTDGRYFLQAEKQLDASSWTLMRSGLPETPTITEFLSTLSSGAVVAVDPFLYSINEARALEDTLSSVGVSLVPIKGGNPVDIVWELDDASRPVFPSGTVRRHDVRYAGRSVTSKLEMLRAVMRENECSQMIFSMLDEVAWIFNIRADGDVPQCPVVLSYARVGLDDAAFYVDSTKVPEEVIDSLLNDGVRIHPYENILQDVLSFSKDKNRIWVDPSSTAWAIGQAAADNIFLKETPVPHQKAVKNDAELAGMREAHVRDGIALCRFLAWLQGHIDAVGTLTEVEAAAKLESFRAAQEGFLSTSFTTIAGSGPNSAIIHYSPVEGKCGLISTREVFLLDSGGQYVDGTTDVTRTMHLGKSATSHEKKCFTRVLKGHIAIDQLTFPAGTTGLMIDAFARFPLWSAGLDYRHGTGHGVGACLNVHEGPHSISPRIGSHKAALCKGMVVSNEPGYYEDGKFGIRIENLVEVVEKETEFNFGEKEYLGFRRLTLVPIDRSMVELELLTTDEIKWLDNYHKEVWERLSPLIEPGKCLNWLREQTRPLTSGVSL